MDNLGQCKLLTQWISTRCRVRVEWACANHYRNMPYTRWLLTELAGRSALTVGMVWMFDVDEVVIRCVLHSSRRCCANDPASSGTIHRSKSYRANHITVYYRRSSDGAEGWGHIEPGWFIMLVASLRL